jgi:hypothetical protein
MYYEMWVRPPRPRAGAAGRGPQQTVVPRYRERVETRDAAAVPPFHPLD